MACRVCMCVGFVAVCVHGAGGGAGGGQRLCIWVWAGGGGGGCVCSNHITHVWPPIPTTTQCTPRHMHKATGPRRHRMLRLWQHPTAHTPTYPRPLPNPLSAPSLPPLCPPPRPRLPVQMPGGGGKKDGNQRFSGLKDLVHFVDLLQVLVVRHTMRHTVRYNTRACVTLPPPPVPSACPKCCRPAAAAAPAAATAAAPASAVSAPVTTATEAPPVPTARTLAAAPPPPRPAGHGPRRHAGGLPVGRPAAKPRLGQPDARALRHLRAHPDAAPRAHRLGGFRVAAGRGLVVGCRCRWRFDVACRCCCCSGLLLAIMGTVVHDRTWLVPRALHYGPVAVVDPHPLLLPAPPPTNKITPRPLQLRVFDFDNYMGPCKQQLRS